MYIKLKDIIHDLVLNIFRPNSEVNSHKSKHNPCTLTDKSKLIVKQTTRG